MTVYILLSLSFGFSVLIFPKVKKYAFEITVLWCVHACVCVQMCMCMHVPCPDF